LYFIKSLETPLQESGSVVQNTTLCEPVGASSFPLALDSSCNIVTCTDCCVGVPFDWIQAHMKDNHGLKCNDQQVLECLNITTPTMKSDEAKLWLSNNQVIKTPIKGIPVLRGYSCSLCPHSAKKKKGIYNHINSAHKDDDIKATIVERNIQKVFQSHLTKYIQVEVEVEEEGTEDWRLKLHEDFTQLVEDRQRIESSGSLDLRLMNAFIAKIRYTYIYILFINIRWDVHLTGVNTQSLFELVKVPTIKDPLHRIILCARRYMKECCKKLSGGNMIVRRELMTAK